VASEIGRLFIGRGPAIGRHDRLKRQKTGNQSFDFQQTHILFIANTKVVIIALTGFSDFDELILDRFNTACRV
jgi:hypothetical protein